MGAGTRCKVVLHPLSPPGIKKWWHHKLFVSKMHQIFILSIKRREISKYSPFCYWRTKHGRLYGQQWHACSWKLHLQNDKVHRPFLKQYGFCALPRKISAGAHVCGFILLPCRNWFGCSWSQVHRLIFFWCPYKTIDDRFAYFMRSSSNRKTLITTMSLYRSVLAGCRLVDETERDRQLTADAVSRVRRAPSARDCRR